MKEIEDILGNTVCKQFRQENIVCPHDLRKNLYTVGALHNIDHDPSSTSAEGSFHSTSIIIIQCPTLQNHCEERILSFKLRCSEGNNKLPDYYTIVPVVSIKQTSSSVPEIDIPDHIYAMNAELQKEFSWTVHGINIIKEAKETILWAGSHASFQEHSIAANAIIVTLPLFMEKADSPAMVKHGMNMIKNITSFLNPSQTPVLAADCPIFAQCKYILWKWPEEFGEKLFVMFGGLHIEKAFWTIIGDILTPSGWTNALSDATVSTTGKADSDLKSSHITRTRKDHQITALTISILQHEAYQLMNTLPQKPFDMRKKEMVETSSTFYFWDLILRLEMQVLIFIKSI